VGGGGDVRLCLEADMDISDVLERRLLPRKVGAVVLDVLDLRLFARLVGERET